MKKLGLAAGAAGVLLAGCGGSGASGSSGSTAPPKDTVTAGPVVSTCIPGYQTADGQFTTHPTNVYAFQLTMRNKSASAISVRYMTMGFSSPGQVPWSGGDSVNTTQALTGGTGPVSGRIAPGTSVTWVFGSTAAGIPAGIAHCALEDWSSAPDAGMHDSHPWPPR